MQIARGRSGVAVPVDTTARARVARALRDQLLTGVLAPGTRLDIDALAVEFSTSRTPVREALLELSYEGLVQVLPRSGVVVVGVTSQELLDNFDIIAVLVGKAAEWAAERRTPRELDELRSLARATISAPADDHVAANWSFHRAVNRAAHSSRIIAQIRVALNMIPSKLLEVLPTFADGGADEHVQLVNALEARDGPLARALAERHVFPIGQSLAAALAAPGAATADQP